MARPTAEEVGRLQDELRKAADACTPTALESARSAYVASVDTGHDNNEVTFKYGKLLILQGVDHRRDVQRGIDLLNGLVLRSYNPSECAFYIALGHFYRAEYRQSRKSLSQLMTSDPSNTRAAALLELVRAKVYQDGTKFAVYAGIAAGAALLLTLWWRRGKGGASMGRDYGSGGRRYGGARGSYARPLYK